MEKMGCPLSYRMYHMYVCVDCKKIFVHPSNDILASFEESFYIINYLVYHFTYFFLGASEDSIIFHTSMYVKHMYVHICGFGRQVDEMLKERESIHSSFTATRPVVPITGNGTYVSNGSSSKNPGEDFKAESPGEDGSSNWKDKAFNKIYSSFDLFLIVDLPTQLFFTVIVPKV